MTDVRPIQAVIFDVAGTLMHTRDSVGAHYAKVAKEFGVEVPASRLEEAFGRVFDAAPPNVHPGVPMRDAVELERNWWRDRVHETFRTADGMLSFDDFEGYFDRLWTDYGQAETWQLAPGAKQALDALSKDGLLLAVLSNFDQRLRGLLRQFDLHEYFEAVTTPADAGAAKPDRLIFDICLKRLGVANHRCVYVGDRAEEDLKGSKCAGLIPVDVTQLATLADLPAQIEAMEKEME